MSKAGFVTAVLLGLAVAFGYPRLGLTHAAVMASLVAACAGFLLGYLVGEHDSEEES